MNRAFSLKSSIDTIKWLSTKAEAVFAQCISSLTHSHTLSVTNLTHWDCMAVLLFSFFMDINTLSSRVINI